MESIDAFVDRLPKVELHLHLTGFGLAGIEQARPAYAEVFRSVFGAAIAAALAANGVRASFLDDAAKRALVAEIEAVSSASVTAG